MNNVYQNTINNAANLSGVGLHSGSKVNLSILPAEENEGIWFKRKDVVGFNPLVKADYKNVTQTTLGTTLANEHGTIVATVEHLMAALWGAGIDNAIIEVEGPEIPIMDGSSEPFLEAIYKAGGATDQTDKIQYIKVLKDIEFEDGDKKVSISPDNSFKVDLEIDFDDETIAYQRDSFDSSKTTFAEYISKARTFGFEHEVEYLRSKGLARGGSLDNAIVVSTKKGILNKEGLRFENEFVRHKILDAIGDLYLAGGKLLGSVKGYKSGHEVNNKLLHKLFADSSSYELATIS